MLKILLFIAVFAVGTHFASFTTPFAALAAAVFATLTPRQGYLTVLAAWATIQGYGFAVLGS